jgi:FixJ family two-component response regulator
MRSSETIVYVVNNDPLETTCLVEFCSTQGLTVICFRSATEYMAKIRDDRTACLILDVNPPDISGLEVQTAVTASGGPPVIFVAAHDDIASGVQAIKRGAVDLLLRPLDYRQLMAAVELAFAQDRKNRNVRGERLSLLTRWQSLTPREREVFQHTVSGLLNKQAAAELGIAENTYQVHRGRVMRKMKAESLAELVRMSTKLEPMIYPEQELTRECLCVHSAWTQPEKTGKGHATAA